MCNNWLSNHTFKLMMMSSNVVALPETQSSIGLEDYFDRSQRMSASVMIAALIALLSAQEFVASHCRLLTKAR